MGGIRRQREGARSLLVVAEIVSGRIRRDNSVISSAYFDEIRDGGAAMTAYCKLQFQELPEHDRHQIQSALLKYCELDTLAMVMIYEAWREML